MTGQLADDKADKITRMSHYSKLFPNFLTMTDAPSERQKVGYTDFETFFFSASMRSIHCSALTAAGRKKARGSPYLPHGPKLMDLICLPTYPPTFLPTYRPTNIKMRNYSANLANTTPLMCNPVQ